MLAATGAPGSSPSTVRLSAVMRAHSVPPQAVSMVTSAMRPSVFTASTCPAKALRALVRRGLSPRGQPPHQAGHVAAGVVLEHGGQVRGRLAQDIAHRGQGHAVAEHLHGPGVAQDARRGQLPGHAAFAGPGVEDAAHVAGIGVEDRAPLARGQGTVQEGGQFAAQLRGQGGLTGGVGTSQADEAAHGVQGRAVVQGQYLSQPGPGVAQEQEDHAQPLARTQAVASPGLVRARRRRPPGAAAVACRSDTGRPRGPRTGCSGPAVRFSWIAFHTSRLGHVCSSLRDRFAMRRVWAVHGYRTQSLPTSAMRQAIPRSICPPCARTPFPAPSRSTP